MQRPQGRGGHHGGDDLHGEAAALHSKQRAGHHHHGQVDRGHPRGQRAVKHRPVQQDVDLVQLVPQYRDADRDRQQGPAINPTPRLTGPGAITVAMMDAAITGSTARYHLSCCRPSRSARRQRRVTLAAAAMAAASPHATARS